MQLSRLRWSSTDLSDTFLDSSLLTEDTKYIDWEDQLGDPVPHYLIVWHNRQGPLYWWGPFKIAWNCYLFVHCHPINIIWNVAKFSARRSMYSLLHSWTKPDRYTWFWTIAIHDIDWLDSLCMHWQSYPAGRIQERVSWNWPSQF